MNTVTIRISLPRDLLVIALAQIGQLYILPPTAILVSQSTVDITPCQ